MVLYILGIGKKFFLFGLVALLFKIAAFRGGALWLGGAEEARKVHTLEVAGSNPASATNRRHSGELIFILPLIAETTDFAVVFAFKRSFLWRFFIAADYVYDGRDNGPDSDRQNGFIL